MQLQSMLGGSQENPMHLEKHVIKDPDKKIPVIAALPFRVFYDREEMERALEDIPTYDPSQQRTTYAGRDYSRSRDEDSAGSFWSSRPDTREDD